MSHFIVFQSQQEAVRSSNCPDHLRLGSFWLCKVSLSVAELTTFSRVLQRETFSPFPPFQESPSFFTLGPCLPYLLSVYREENGSANMAHPLFPALWHLAACREHKLWLFSWPCDKCGSHIPDLLREFCYFQVCCYQFCNYAWFRGSLLGSYVSRKQDLFYKLHRWEGWQFWWPSAQSLCLGWFKSWVEKAQVL